MIYTIGHSTHPEEEFISLLKHYKIQTLVDVRTIPKSRWNPQFNTAAMQKSLPAAGIEYVHEPELGGLRKPSNNSINLAWENEGFRGYADYMQTPQFETALNRLIERSKNKVVAIMCAEAFFGKCHRKLLSDALVVRGVEVLHIVSEKQSVSHELTSFARVSGHRITYPAAQSDLEF
jgi:uncharacterized protein (DUF488 family)